MTMSHYGAMNQTGAMSQYGDASSAHLGVDSGNDGNRTERHGGPAEMAMVGVSSSVAPLRRVLMRRPGAILDADPQRWHYAKIVDAAAMQVQYDRFTDLVVACGATVEWIDDDVDDGLADSVFTYDPSFMLPSGAVVLRPGKPLRVGESALHRSWYLEHGVPVLGEIAAPGTVEGGDIFWLDPATIAVGRGFRTNQAGIDQLAMIAADDGIEVEVFDLPYFNGPDACLHLMSLVSPLADDLALIYAPLLPTALYWALIDRGVRLLHACQHEFEASAGLSLNVLATAPRQAIAIEGFPETHRLMRDAGCEVTTFDGSELCLPCEGGPTCLTRPLHRA